MNDKKEKQRQQKKIEIMQPMNSLRKQIDYQRSIGCNHTANLLEVSEIIGDVQCNIIRTK
jgi:hypothetical protein